MGVYVKGMKMPPNCMLCPLCVEEADPANGEMCMVTGTLMPPCTRERLDNCPLSHVPPHGRLIDADALAEKHRELAYELRGANYDFHMTACSWVNSAPTIIPAEEGE